MITLDEPYQAELRHGGGPFRLAALVPEATPTGMLGLTKDHMRNAYAKAFALMLAGGDERLDRIVVRASARLDPMLDAISLQLLRHAGIRPQAAAATAHMLAGRMAHLVDETGRSVAWIDWQVSTARLGSETSVPIGDGVQWNGGHMVATALPDAVMAAAVGRPLRRLISHPVLDRHDLDVTGTRVANGRLVLVTNADRTPKGFDEA